MEIGNGVDREHRSDSRENWGRFSARGATRGANVRTTCVGGSVLLSFTLAKSQSRLTPTRAASERPSNPLRPLPSQPSLPSSLPPSSKRVCAPAALLASPSFFRFYPLLILLRILFFFFSSRPRIWPQTIARSPRIVRERRGEEEGLRGFRGTREQGCLEDILLFSFFFFFHPNRILFVARDAKRGRKGWRWKNFSSPLVCDCSFGEEDVSSYATFFWRNFVVSGSIIDGFGTGFSYLSPLVNNIIRNNLWRFDFFDS